MLDVHPPHHAANTWKDFFTHIATIVVGLLIAIGLEQSVEAIHHHHQRVETRDNLREEIKENQAILAQDIKALTSEHKMLEADIETLHKIGAHQPVAPHSLHFAWYWDSMRDSAWQTARETTSIALFPTEQIQGYSLTYGQQALVNEAGGAVDHFITDTGIALRIQPDVSALTPAQIDEMIRGCATALNQIDFASALINSLEPKYRVMLQSF